MAGVTTNAFPTIAVIPTLSNLIEFNRVGAPDPRPNLPDDHGLADFSRNATFQNFITSINRDRVWTRDANGNIVEFSPEIKVMFLNVARIVAGINANGQCAGDLIHRIRINGGLSVFFPFPNKAVDMETTLDQGFFTDLIHFRQMVADVIMATVINFDANIPFHIKLFFSEIFVSDQLSLYAYLQLMHPIFYDANQRCAFFQLHKEYIEENYVAGNALRLLNSWRFPFRGWNYRFPGNPFPGDPQYNVWNVFNNVFNYNPTTYQNGLPSTLPIYMRNFQYHCRTRRRLNPTHEEMDALLHQTYPGVAEAVVDSHIRGNHIIWFQPQKLPLYYPRCHRTLMDYLITKPFPFVILRYEYRYW